MVFQLNHFITSCISESDVVEICKIHPTMIFHHPIYCQLYYCKTRVHLTECSYPYLFSKETLRCENYTNVKCGNRFEIKWPCKFTVILIIPKSNNDE